MIFVSQHEGKRPEGRDARATHDEFLRMGRLVQGTGFGVVGDIIIGIIGAFIGAWLLPQLGIRIGAGLVSAIAGHHRRRRASHCS